MPGSKSNPIPHWRRLHAGKKRAGVCVPLFSIYSGQSIGVGEIPDLRLLVDWCKKTGQTLIQLLPLNDTGFNFRPYDAESSFAIEPMHLSLTQLQSVDGKKFEGEIAALRERFPIEKGAGKTAKRVDPGIKAAKLQVLRKIYSDARLRDGEKAFESFKHENKFWLKPYTEYKVFKEKNGNQSWEHWSGALMPAEASSADFYAWLQWQLYLQMTEAKRYANKKGVFLMGDIPFLVSRDSADVWSNPDAFKLDKSAGAPPDMYLAEGQQWGMPPYHWEALEARGYDYFVHKLRYAENFYDLFRIDHFVGIFRIWTFPEKAFDPPDESVWDAHGRKILDMMLKHTRMLPCAEDLGCIPECSFKLLEETQIPGVDVQRWMRDWKGTKDFLPPEQYRKNAVAVISTHDMSPLKTWWETETQPEEREKFWVMLGMKGKPREKATTAFIKKCFEVIHRSSSVFSIQLWQDWLSLGGYLSSLSPEDRLNIPGSVSENFWRLQMPLALEKLNTLPMNRVIFGLNKKRS